MNDEIKEILEQLEWYRKIGKKDVYYPECVLPNKKAFLLLDYITNLQQESERLKERVAYLERSNNRREDTIIGLRFEVAEQEDYKSRCEKASEKLGNYKHYSTPTEKQNSENEDIVDSALNILQGENNGN